MLRFGNYVNFESSGLLSVFFDYETAHLAFITCYFVCMETETFKVSWRNYQKKKKKEYIKYRIERHMERKKRYICYEKKKKKKKKNYNRGAFWCLTIANFPMHSYKSLRKEERKTTTKEKSPLYHMHIFAFFLFQSRLRKNKGLRTVQWYYAREVLYLGFHFATSKRI